VFDWSSVIRVEMFLQATGSNNVYVIFDAVRMSSAINYPQRLFDLGLQFIPVASFDGNTALYEVQTACESEGARFFADENGVLHFENRQHYNLPQYKSAVYEYNFGRTTEFEHPDPTQGLINTVNVHLQPRHIVASKTIWNNLQPFLIPHGATVTVWATFQDPVPTTTSGLVTPVSTTDFLANDASDGSGTDRTSNISIVTTKFTKSAKLDITNGYSGDVYMTLLQLRGTPAEQGDEIIVKLVDATSVAQFGESPAGGYDVASKYLSDITYANTLGQQLIDWYKNPLSRVINNVNALPQLQIGDMISVVNNYVAATFLMRLLGLTFSYSNNNGLKGTINARSVNPFETLTLFQIGSSSIGGTDVISS
jgi:hypothetical protein